MPRTCEIIFKFERNDNAVNKKVYEAENYDNFLFYSELDELSIDKENNEDNFGFQIQHLSINADFEF